MKVNPTKRIGALCGRKLWGYCRGYGAGAMLFMVIGVSSVALGGQSEAPPRVPPAFEQGASATSAEAGGVDLGTLPRNLSPWGMFLEADRVVKGVIIGLIFASIVTWTTGLAKSVEVGMGKRRLRETLEELERVHTLEEGMDRLHDAGGIESVYGQAVERELHFSGASGAEKAGIQERIASRLGRIESAAGRRIARGTGMLATIGATAPFVGLFGTVWGIMNSFIGISEAQTTNLAVVAPGIAEALLVTAMGLITAIPAVVMYNFFARSIAGYRALLADISSEVLQLISRELNPQPLMSAVPAERQRWLRNVGE